MGKERIVRKNFVVFLTLFVGILFASNILEAMNIFDAAKAGDTSRLEYLSQQEGFDVDQAGTYDETDDMTALMVAAINDQKNAVNLLLDMGADLNKTNIYGITALSLAAKHHKDDTAKQLFEKRRDKFKNIISQKCAFLTFTQEDMTGAIFGGILSALSQKVVCIASAYLLRRLAFQYRFLSDFFASGKLSLFVNSKENLGVIISVSIPENVDALNVLKDYGFKNLTYINKEQAIKKLKLLTNVLDNSQIKELINDFKDIIDTANDDHPTRFYLSGHGAAPIIADIPLENMEDLFNVLADIDTQFLYINTCNAGGKNIIEMQNKIQEIIRDRWKNQQEGSSKIGSIKNIDYTIAIQATTDIPTYGSENIGTFFIKLNNYYRYLAWFKFGGKTGDN